MKICTKCKIKKDFSEFYKRKNHIYSSREYYSSCKNCCREYKKTNQKRYSINMNRLNRLPKNRYKLYIYESRRKNLDFKIDYKYFNFLTKNICYYCGSKDSIGIDRLDNTKGYLLDNCVPCCTSCNYAKKDRTVLDFIEHCNKVVEYQKSKYQD